MFSSSRAKFLILGVIRLLILLINWSGENLSIDWDVMALVSWRTILGWAVSTGRNCVWRKLSRLSFRWWRKIISIRMSRSQLKMRSKPSSLRKILCFWENPNSKSYSMDTTTHVRRRSHKNLNNWNNVTKKVIKRG